MSSLREMLESRRASESAPAHTCHGIEAQPACLMVIDGTGESWVFPWTHLAAAHLAKALDREQLRLIFTTHEVRLGGRNLTALRDLAAKLQLARVHPAPRKYDKAADGEPFLESIHVAPHKPSPGSGGTSV